MVDKLHVVRDEYVFNDYASRFFLFSLCRMFCVIVFYWVLRCARSLDRARSFSLLLAIMFILRLLVHKLQWPSGTNKKRRHSKALVK